MRKYLILATIIISGILSSALGVTVMLGWLLEIERLTSIFTTSLNTHMVFNSSFCFIIMGISILASAVSGPKYIVPRCLTAVVFIIVMLILSQALFNYNLGIDQLIVQVHVIDSNPVPGRMALTAIFCFSIACAIIWLLSYSAKKIIGIIINLLIFILFYLTLTTLLGHLLKLNFFYAWYGYWQMAFNTSIGMFIVTIGLTALWWNHPNYQTIYSNNQNTRILLYSSLTLAVAVYIGVLVCFAALSRTTHLLMADLLEESTNQQVNALLYAEHLSNDNMESLINNITLELTKNSEQRNFTLAHDPDFTYIAVYDSNGRLVYSHGTPIHPDMAVKLNTYYPSQLLWHNNWYINYNVKLTSHQKPVGTLITNWSFKNFDLLVPNKLHLGKSLETLICYPLPVEKARCFPSQINQEPFTFDLKISKNNYHAMYYAFLGQRGVTSNIDYRGHSTLAAYSPVDNLGLGVVTKIDLLDVYRPIKEEFQNMMLALLSLTIIIGIIVLYRLIKPVLQQLAATQNKLSYQATHDTLTGLSNRAQLEQDYNRAVIAAQRHANSLALLYIDIDKFKNINDNLGHAGGDDLLQQFAEYLRHSVRIGDLVARLGGDEFVVILTDIKSSDDVEIVVHKILNSIPRFVINDTSYTINVSIGISLYPTMGTDYTTLLKKADNALYTAKQNGRNQYRFYSDSLT